MAKKVWVVLQQRDGQVARMSWEAIAAVPVVSERMQDNAGVLNIRRFAALLILASMPVVAQEAAPAQTRIALPFRHRVPPTIIRRCVKCTVARARVYHDILSG